MVGFRPSLFAFLTIIEQTPCVCIGEEDNIGVMDFDELQEIGEDYFLRSLEPLLALIEDLDAGDPWEDLGSPNASIPRMLKGNWKSGENLDCISISA